MIAPILAGLGALALMSNPPRRRRRRSNARRNPGKVIVLTWSEDDGIELTGRQVWRDGILREEHRLVPKARALVFSRDAKELSRAKDYAAREGYRVRVMADSEDVLERARAIEAKRPTRSNPRRRRRSKVRRNPGGWWAAYKERSGAWSVQRIERHDALLQAERDGWQIVLGDTQEKALKALEREAKLRGIELAQRTNPPRATGPTPHPATVKQAYNQGYAEGRDATGDLERRGGWPTPTDLDTRRAPTKFTIAWRKGYDAGRRAQPRANPAPRFTEAAAKRLCRIQGIRGNHGGWVEVTPGHRVQGWHSVARWLRLAYERMEFEKATLLLEIAEGRRIGMPTLSKSQRLDRAAGILSGKPVSWRT